MERQAFSIDDALRRYFRQPKAFRKIMLDTNTLVSGSFAVQYFLHTEFADADIDMYIGPGPRPQTESDKDESTGKPVLSWTNAQRVIDHLTKVEDYDWCSDTNSYINIHHIEVVKTFFGPPHHSAAYNSPKIQLVLLKTDPVTNILQTYYATHILNFITGKAAYCLFPEQTLARKAYLSRDPRMYDVVLEEKYGALKPERGFVNGDVRDFGMVLEEGKGVRWIGDEQTWTVRFSDARQGEIDKEDGVVGAKFGMQVVMEEEGNKERRWLQIRRLENE